MSFLLEKECFQHLRETHLGREQFLRDAKSRFEKGNAKVAMIFTGNLFIIFLFWMYVPAVWQLELKGEYKWTFYPAKIYNF